MDYCLRKFDARFCGSQLPARTFQFFKDEDSNGDCCGRINHIVLAVEYSIIRCQVRTLIRRGELLW